MSNLKKDKTLVKIKRLEGQVAAVRRMYEEGRECMDVVQQIAAVKSALSGVAKDMLTSEACQCAGSAKKKGKLDKVLKALVNIN